MAPVLFGQALEVSHLACRLGALSLGWGRRFPQSEADSGKEDGSLTHARDPFLLRWVRGLDAEGNRLVVEKTVRNWTPVLPDPEKAPLGARLRFLRKRQGLRIVDLARLTGVSHNPISRIERGQTDPDPAILGRLIAYFGEEARSVLAGGGDPYDHAIPVKDFGSWLRNFRMRKELKQNELAKIMGVSKVTVWSYERQGSKPKPQILNRLRRRFKLNGEVERFL